ncbi:MAG: hypothetical protein U1E70_23385 [Acetobacteraceae bacterium]|nr:hypothetical protein [Pseudomonadota bacterium]
MAASACFRLACRLAYIAGYATLGAPGRLIGGGMQATLTPALSLSRLRSRDGVQPLAALPPDGFSLCSKQAASG